MFTVERGNNPSLDVIFVKHFLSKFWAKSIRKWLISPFFGSFIIRLSVNY